MKKVILISLLVVLAVRADENPQENFTYDWAKVGEILKAHKKNSSHYLIEKTAAQRKKLLDGFESIKHPVWAWGARIKAGSSSPEDCIVNEVKQEYAGCPDVVLETVKILKESCQEINDFLSKTENKKAFEAFAYGESENAQKIYKAMQEILPEAKKRSLEDQKKYPQQFAQIPTEHKDYWDSWHRMMVLREHTHKLQAEDPIFQDGKKNTYAKNNPKYTVCINNKAFYMALIPVIQTMKIQDFESAKILLPQLATPEPHLLTQHAILKADTDQTQPEDILVATQDQTAVTPTPA